MYVPVLLSLALAAPGGAERLAVTRVHSEAASGIAVVGLAGTPLAVLTRRRGRHDSGPAWSPDGRRIAFSRTTNDWRSFRIHVMRADGTGVRRITAGLYDDDPSWSPDGRTIVFTSLPRPSQTDCRFQRLYLVGSRGGRPRLVRGTDRATNPSFSPDGRRLLFEQDGRVVTARRDGTGRAVLDRGSAPAWSPDGTRIAYIAGRGLLGDVAVMDTHGGSPRRVLRNRVFDDDPAWSPDGTRIAFDSVRGDDHATYVLDLATGRERRVLAHSLEPAWRP